MTGSGPCARSGHTLTACGSKFYLFGGTGRLEGMCHLLLTEIAIVAAALHFTYGIPTFLICMQQGKLKHWVISLSLTPATQRNTGGARSAQPNQGPSPEQDTVL